MYHHLENISSIRNNVQPLVHVLHDTTHGIKSNVVIHSTLFFDGVDLRSVNSNLSHAAKLDDLRLYSFGSQEETNQKRAGCDSGIRDVSSDTQRTTCRLAFRQHHCCGCQSYHHYRINATYLNPH